MSIIEHLHKRTTTSKYTTATVFVAIVMLLIATLTAGLTTERPAKDQSSQESASAGTEQTKGDVGDENKMPQNPVKRVAMKALAGKYGNLADWQYKAYKYALAQDADIEGIAWVTSYGPWEGFMFDEACAFGYAFSDSTASSNLIPSHYYVLI